MVVAFSVEDEGAAGARASLARCAEAARALLRAISEEENEEAAALLLVAA